MIDRRQFLTGAAVAVAAGPMVAEPLASQRAVFRPRPVGMTMSYGQPSAMERAWAVALQAECERSAIGITVLETA